MLPSYWKVMFLEVNVLYFFVVLLVSRPTTFLVLVFVVFRLAQCSDEGNLWPHEISLSSRALFRLSDAHELNYPAADGFAGMCFAAFTARSGRENNLFADRVSWVMHFFHCRGQGVLGVGKEKPADYRMDMSHLPGH